VVSVTDPYGRVLGFLDRDDNNNTNTNNNNLVIITVVVPPSLTPNWELVLTFIIK
jgi:hypothetical protein